MSAIIEIEDLWKEYRLGVISHGYLARDLQRLFARILGRKDPHALVAGDEHEGTSYWALKGVDIKVGAGEVLGIIGKNGAGKSTLLKILSRITSPTRGCIRLKGRMASLLEVGTGFHPELTGRDNIFLNGAILGMNRREIRARLEGIIDFSGIEKFIDTPVKRYSSGMYVRLAFAVAAHLDPEILVVDEVLAVGDLEFQRKCLGKMREISGSGRTILFVSHNLAAIQSLCTRAILLDQGKVVDSGDPSHVVASYMERNLIKGAMASREDIESRVEGVILKKDPYLRYESVRVTGMDGEARTSYSSGEQIAVRIAFHCLRKAYDVILQVRIVDEEGRPIIISMSADSASVLSSLKELEPGSYECTCIISPALLAGRTFFVSTDLICTKAEHLVLDRILEFDVVFEGYNGFYMDSGTAFARPQFEWTLAMEKGIE